MQRGALRKLLILGAAGQLGDLRLPPGNRLQKLQGDREGEHSIRVDEQWRICSRWRGGDAYDVAIADCHSEGLMATAKMAPIHPGEILLAELLEPLEISQYRVARDISVPPRRMHEIVHGTRAITADTALRLARYHGTSDRCWLNLQTRYDVPIEKDRLGNRLADVLQRAGSQALGAWRALRGSSSLK